MVKKILLGLVLVVVAFCAYVATLPSEFRYESSRIMPTSSVAIFPHVNNQHEWLKWSPWVKVDPNAQFTFEGPDEGVGSIARWKGNMEVGEGSATITESTAPDRIVFAMDFVKPMAAKNDAEFTFKTVDGGTKVTWAMYGTADYFGKFIGVLMNCEPMVEDMFSQGLANLETVALKEAPAAVFGEKGPVDDEKAEEVPAAN